MLSFGDRLRHVLLPPARQGHVVAVRLLGCGRLCGVPAQERGQVLEVALQNRIVGVPDPVVPGVVLDARQRAVGHLAGAPSFHNGDVTRLSKSHTTIRTFSANVGTSMRHDDNPDDYGSPEGDCRKPSDQAMDSTTSGAAASSQVVVVQAVGLSGRSAAGLGVAFRECDQSQFRLHILRLMNLLLHLRRAR
jgi:hypothetical protein